MDYVYLLLILGILLFYMLSTAVAWNYRLKCILHILLTYICMLKCILHILLTYICMLKCILHILLTYICMFLRSLQ